ncbi:hypothetical protein SFUMM280S_09049 [Streptomyces fumanus]
MADRPGLVPAGRQRGPEPGGAVTGRHGRDCCPAGAADAGPAQAVHRTGRTRCRARPHGRISRMRGQHRKLTGQPLLAQLGQPVVPGLAHQLGQLGPVGDVHRLARAVRRGRRRAPPVQVVAARPPAAAVVLTDRHLEHARVVGPVDPLVRPPDRQLPAHVRLGLQRLAALPQRQDVQRAAGAAGEAGPVLEDARPLERAGLAGTLLVLRHPAVHRALGVVLPDVRGEPVATSSGDPPLVVLVGEVRAQRAAAVVRAARLVPWQPLPKMQLQREVSQVRSQRKTCSSSAGSGNSTHARAKSSPFSSPIEGFRAISPFFALLPFLAGFSSFAFFVFGTRPG